MNFSFPQGKSRIENLFKVSEEKAKKTPSSSFSSSLASQMAKSPRNLISIIARNRASRFHRRSLVALDGQKPSKLFAVFPSIGIYLDPPPPTSATRLEKRDSENEP